MRETEVGARASRRVWFRSMCPVVRLPDFLIVGAMKSGTTSLAKWLGDHPDVFVPESKELHFFDLEWKRGVRWYAGHFDALPPDTLVGEATPAYMAHAFCVPRMADVVPNARLIAVLREPVSRAWSHYQHLVAKNGERRTFEEILGIEMTLRQDDSDIGYYFRARGHYIEQLTRITDRFPRSHVLVELFDELVLEPHEAMRRVCRFLDIEEVVPAVVGTAYNQRAPVARGVRNVWGALHRKEEMARYVRHELHEHFRPYNRKLAAWLGRELPPSWAS